MSAAAVEGREGFVILLLFPNARVCWGLVEFVRVEPGGRPRFEGGMVEVGRAEGAWSGEMCFDV